MASTAVQDLTRYNQLSVAEKSELVKTLIATVPEEGTENFVKYLTSDALEVLLVCAQVAQEDAALTERGMAIEYEIKKRFFRMTGSASRHSAAAVSPPPPITSASFSSGSDTAISAPTTVPASPAAPTPTPISPAATTIADGDNPFGGEEVMVVNPAPETTQTSVGEVRWVPEGFDPAQLSGLRADALAELEEVTEDLRVNGPGEDDELIEIDNAEEIFARLESLRDNAPDDELRNLAIAAIGSLRIGIEACSGA